MRERREVHPHRAARRGGPGAGSPPGKRSRQQVPRRHAAGPGGHPRGGRLGRHGHRGQCGAHRLARPAGRHQVPRERDHHVDVRHPQHQLHEARQKDGRLRRLEDRGRRGRAVRRPGASTT